MAKPNGEALRTYEVHTAGRDVEVKAHDFIVTHDNMIEFRRRNTDSAMGMYTVAAFALGDGDHVKEKDA